MTNGIITLYNSYFLINIIIRYDNEHIVNAIIINPEINTNPEVEYTPISSVTGKPANISTYAERTSKKCDIYFPTDIQCISEVADGLSTKTELAIIPAMIQHEDMYTHTALGDFTIFHSFLIHNSIIIQINKGIITLTMINS